jgi:hypothetical protein
VYEDETESGGNGGYLSGGNGGNLSGDNGDNLGFSVRTERETCTGGIVLPVNVEADDL